MSVILVNVILAVWLLVSAFALGHTPLSATITVVVAVAVGILARLSSSKPGIRWVNSALTLVLVGCAVLLPSLSVAARVNTVVVGLVLLALSAISPVHGQAHGRPHTVGPAGTRPPDPD